MAEAPDINVDELRRRARRRLIGAIVLALAAAVVVPMLLESDPKPLGEDVSVKIPQQDNDKFVNRLSDKSAKTGTAAPAPTSEPVKAPSKADLAPAQDAPTEPKAGVSNLPPPKSSIATAEQKMLGGTSKPASTAPPAAPIVGPAAAPMPAAPPASTGSAAMPAPVDTAKPAMEGFSVQLAAFADDKGANALANKLKRADYPAYTEPLTTSKGTLWRVRVGPYPSRESAIDVRDKLKSEGYSGIVAAAK